MTYLSEIRIFLITTVALLIIIAMSGFFVFLRVSDTLAVRYRNEVDAAHRLSREWILSGEEHAHLLNFVDGYVISDAAGTPLRSHPEGTAEYFLELRDDGAPLDPALSTPLIIPGSEKLNPLALCSTLPDATVLTTFHDNPLPVVQKMRFVYFGTLSFVAAGMLVLTFFFITRRIARPFENLFSQAERSPAAPAEKARDPEYIIRTLKDTIARLEEFSRSETRRADTLQILAATLSRNLPSGLLVLDRDGEVIRSSSLAEEVLNFQRSSLPLPFQELLSNWPALMSLVGEVHEIRVVRQREEVEENGKKLAATVVPLFDESDTRLGTIVLFVDRTEIARMEEDLRRQKSFAELGIFASGIAHEFRNSIATIEGYLKMYRKKENPKHLKEIENETRHILNVTARFLEFSQHRKLDRSEVEMVSVIESLVKKMRPAYPDTELKIEGKKIICRVDPTLLEQALRNILENSFQAARQVEISVGASGGFVEIEIRDNGPGIPEEVLEGIHLPFVSGRSDGTGLGLAIAYKVIHEHEGTVEHANRKEGGVACRILLPLNVKK